MVEDYVELFLKHLKTKHKQWKKQCKTINTCIKHVTGLLPLVPAMQPAPPGIAPEVHLHGNRFKIEQA